MQNSWLWVMSGMFPGSYVETRTGLEMSSYNPNNILHVRDYTTKDAFNSSQTSAPFTTSMDSIVHNMPNTVFNGTYRFDFPIDHNIIEDLIIEVGMHISAGPVSCFTPKAGMKIFEYIEFHGGGTRPVVQRLEGDQIALIEEIQHKTHQRSDDELGIYNFDVATQVVVSQAATGAAPATYKFRLPFHFCQDQKQALKTCKYTKTAPYIYCKLVPTDDYILEDAAVDHSDVFVSGAWSAATDTVTIDVLKLHLKYVDYAPEMKAMLKRDETVPMKVWGQSEKFSWAATGSTSPSIQISTKGMCYGYMLVVRHTGDLPELHDSTNTANVLHSERHSDWILQRLNTITLKHGTVTVWNTEPAQHFLGHILIDQLDDHEHIPVHYGAIGDNASYGNRFVNDGLVITSTAANQRSGTKYIYFVPVFSHKAFKMDHFHGGLDNNRTTTTLTLTTPLPVFAAGNYHATVWPLMYQDVLIKEDEMVLKENYDE